MYIRAWVIVLVEQENFMEVIASSDLLREFTLFAERAVDNDEIFVVQRANGKNVVLLSMDKYNDFNKEMFLLKKSNASEKR